MNLIFQQRAYMLNSCGCKMCGASRYRHALPMSTFETKCSAARNIAPESIKSSKAQPHENCFQSTQEKKKQIFMLR